MALLAGRIFFAKVIGQFDAGYYYQSIIEALSDTTQNSVLGSASFRELAYLNLSDEHVCQGGDRIKGMCTPSGSAVL
jgi:hypothetical protein